MANYLFHEGPQQVISLPEALANINAKVLDDRTLRTLVDPEIYMAFETCRATGTPMEKTQANALAKSIREWAQSKGCVGFSHWFSPVRGPHHGQKLDTFMSLDFSTGNLIVNLSGFDLFQTETDGSSFPNGGLRETHMAAAYMGWDTASPPFVYDDILVIPSSFVSWTGEALDQKTPLLRSSDAVNEQALRMLRLAPVHYTEPVRNLSATRPHLLDAPFEEQHADMFGLKAVYSDTFAHVMKQMEEKRKTVTPEEIAHAREALKPKKKKSKKLVKK